ncbi:MAG: DUF2911 domain-containing protein [Cyclobacteriaceae bacterium]|jgi:hypothetical protein
MKLKKIILLIFLGIILIGAGFVAYIMLTTKSHSPAEKLEYTDGDLILTVEYCRPYKKGRLIFGEKSEGALLPFGEYWRTGANEATEVEFNKDISINGNSLPAGRYRFYTVPGKSDWTIAFNSELGKWGYGEPDYDLDVLVLEIPSIDGSDLIEQFTISATKTSEKRMELILAWDRTKVSIPINY